jgi:nucleoside phosphorylase
MSYFNNFLNTDKDFLNKKVIIKYLPETSTILTITDLLFNSFISNFPENLFIIKTDIKKYLYQNSSINRLEIEIFIFIYNKETNEKIGNISFFLNNVSNVNNDIFDYGIYSVSLIKGFGIFYTINNIIVNYNDNNDLNIYMEFPDSNELIVISAVKEEILTNYNIQTDLLKIIPITNSPLNTYRIISENSTCLYIVSNVGKANSAYSIGYAKSLGAKKILWLGTAGITPELKVGDYCIIERSIYIDSNFTEFGLPLGQEYGEDLFQYTNKDFSNYVYDLFYKFAPKKNVYNNITSGTSDSFITNYNLLNLFPKSYNIKMTNNEDNSSLQITNNLGKIKQCIIRCASDVIGTPSQDSQYTKILKISSKEYRNFLYYNLLYIKNYE